MKHGKLVKIGYWVLEQVAKLKRAWNLVPVLQIVQWSQKNIVFA